MKYKLILFIILCVTRNLMAQLPNYISPDSLQIYYPFNGDVLDHSGHNRTFLATPTYVDDNNFNPNSAIKGELHILPFDPPPATITPIKLTNNLVISYWMKSSADETVSGLSQHCINVGLATGISGYPKYCVSGLKFGNGLPLVNMGTNCDNASTCNGVMGLRHPTQGTIPWRNRPEYYNTWVHYVARAYNGRVEIYLNGVQVVDPYYLNNSSASLANISMDKLYFRLAPTDVIDDVCFYNRNLTGTEIWSLFNQSPIVPHFINGIIADKTAAVGTSTSFQLPMNQTYKTSGDYQWQLSNNGGNSWVNISNNNIYANSTTDSLVINNVTSNMVNYKYRCIFKYAFDTPDTSNIATLNGTTTSIIDPAKTIFNIYPNPLNDKLVIEVDGFKYVELYDLLGRLQLKDDKQIIETSSLSKGDYIVKTYTNSTVFTRKINKQ